MEKPTLYEKLRDLREALVVAKAPSRELDLAITNIVEPFMMWGTPIPYEWGGQMIEPGSQSIAVVAVPEMPEEVQQMLEKELLGMERSVIIPRKYTESVDAALHLIDTMLPGVAFSIGRNRVCVRDSVVIIDKDIAAALCLATVSVLLDINKS